MTTLLLLLTLLDRPSDPGETVQVHNFATHTLKEAKALEGKRAVYWVEVRGARVDALQETRFKCVGPPLEFRFVWLCRPFVERKVMVVEATMRLHWCFPPNEDQNDPKSWAFILEDSKALDR